MSDNSLIYELLRENKSLMLTLQDSEKNDALLRFELKLINDAQIEIRMKLANSEKELSRVTLALEDAEKEIIRLGLLLKLDIKNKNLPVLNAELEQKVEARTSDLQHANQELQNANKALENLAREDVLTKLPNRLAANERLHEEFIRMKRTQRPYAVLMLDIDFFKRVNDTYGHAVGDEVLQTIAASLKETIRTNDFAARFGGEEFLVLLPETNLDAGHAVAEKIRHAIQSLKHPHIGKITISIGLEIATPEQTNEYEAVNEADNWLYVAKNSGRNQVKSISEKIEPS